MDAERRAIFSVVDTEIAATRREVLRFAGLSGVGALLLTLGGQIREARAQSGGDAHAGDLKILNVALGLEHEAIAAYQAGAESGLLQKAVLDVAVLFQSQHIQHRDAITATVKKAGGMPVEPKKMSEYAWPRLASQKDVLMFAATLEAGAASAYLGALKAIQNKDYLTAAASIMGNETQHLSLLRQALAENPVPSAFIS
ncbi:MAG: ferritin-like domain-containing protein [Candidatus Rokubacteria bacterium]|nr:ferritin-like domain-containing protein [Candidatus Rokubacteria bacterium]